MVHGDDSGLILPPRIAPHQVVIVPIPRGDWRVTVLPRARDIAAALRRAGVRVMLDDREEYKPGWKFAEWEMRGVPLRLEIGSPGYRAAAGSAGAPRHPREAHGADGWTRGACDGPARRRADRALRSRAGVSRQPHRADRVERHRFPARLRGPARIRSRPVVRIRRVRGADQGGHAGHHPQPGVRPAPGDRRLRALRPGRG